MFRVTGAAAARTDSNGASRQTSGAGDPDQWLI